MSYGTSSSGVGIFGADTFEVLVWGCELPCAYWDDPECLPFDSSDETFEGLNTIGFGKLAKSLELPLVLFDYPVLLVLRYGLDIIDASILSERFLYLCCC